MIDSAIREGSRVHEAFGQADAPERALENMSNGRFTEVAEA